MNDLEQLQYLRLMIDYYLEECPTNSGMYSVNAVFDPNDIDKPLRDGVFFYSSGWGWRLRQDWQAVLEQRLNEAE